MNFESLASNALRYSMEVHCQNFSKTYPECLLLHPQIMLENPDKEWGEGELPQIYGKYTPKDLSRVMNHMNRLAVIMREKRFESGALRIEQPKLQFMLESGSGLPLEYSVYANKECHR